MRWFVWMHVILGLHLLACLQKLVRFGLRQRKKETGPASSRNEREGGERNRERETKQQSRRENNSSSERERNVY